MCSEHDYHHHHHHHGGVAAPDPAARLRSARARRGGPDLDPADPATFFAMAKRLRHRGFGPDGFGPDGGFGPRGFGPGGPHGRRRRKRGEIREAILHLLADRPMHGYEVIQEIGERSGGRWTPSPGSVYPMLQLLEDEGLVSPEEQEGRKVYSLTDDGRTHVEQHLAEQAPPWEPSEDEIDSPHHRMRTAMMQVGMAARQVAQAGDAEQAGAAIAVLEEARRALYGILAEGAPPSGAGGDV